MEEDVGPSEDEGKQALCSFERKPQLRKRTLLDCLQEGKGCWKTSKCLSNTLVRRRARANTILDSIRLDKLSISARKGPTTATRYVVWCTQIWRYQIA